MSFSDLANKHFARRAHWVFALATTLFYFSLTPGTIEGQGYNGENLLAADQLATNLFHLLRGESLAPLNWTRHGAVELIFELPFVLAGRLMGSSAKWGGRLMVLQPILATAMLGALIFVWTRRLTGSLRWGYLQALTAALGTMLWPYAYVGLETTQSLFLLVAAYLALGRDGRGSWPATLCFALACAVTISVKLNGGFLVPAIGYLIFCYFRKEAGQEKVQAWKAKAMATVAIIAGVFALNYYFKSRYWAGSGGGSTRYFLNAMVDSPLTVLLQAFSYFGSANKSLLIYAPVTALCFAALPRAYRAHPRIVIFALLVLGGLIGGFSLVTVWTEETWGPRYLHAAIGPLVVCLAAAREATPLRLRREMPLLALGAIGLAVSFLGCFFYSGHLHSAATRTGQNTLEAIQYDPAFNHPGFNLKLLKVWGQYQLGYASTPEAWPPPRHWWFERPADAPPERTVDLREYATPQPIVARGWQPSIPLSPFLHRCLRLLCLLCLALSVGLFAWLARLQSEKVGQTAEFARRP